MDEADVDAGQLAGALAFIRRVNTALGYTRATVGHVARLAASLPAGRPLTVLDVATGSGDVPAALLAWARRAGRSVRVVGLDLHAGTLDLAAAHLTSVPAAAAGGVAVPLVRGDALALPFADGAFDVVMTSMFLHHLPDAAVVAALREMARVAGHAVVAADLVRHPRAYAGIWLLTAASGPLLRHDARVSVRQAFTPDEIRRLAFAAGLRGAKTRLHFGHRFVLTARTA